jgi:hypothetical protein
MNFVWLTQEIWFYVQIKLIPKILNKINDYVSYALWRHGKKSSWWVVVNCVIGNYLPQFKKHFTISYE